MNKRVQLQACADTPNLPVLNANKWRLVANVTGLLGIFHQVAVQLSERQTTAAEIIPQLKYLETFIANAFTRKRYVNL